MYVDRNRKRFDMSFDLPESVLEEVKKILDSIKDCPTSKAYDIENDDSLETKESDNHFKCGGCVKGEEIEITIQESIKENTTCKK